MRRIAVLILTFAATMLVPTGTLAGDEERNCAAFATQAEAQAYFDAHGGSKTNNVDSLDADRDGTACEHLSGTSGTSPDDSGTPWPRIAIVAISIVAAGAGGAGVYLLSRKASQSATTAAPIRPIAPMLPALPDVPDDIPCDPPPPGWPTVTPDRARELAAMSDADYRITPEWTQRAEAILIVTGNRCQLCGADLMLLEDVRRRTDERRGNELPCDLIVLCDRCAAQLGIAST
ncbi:MAG: excalibur calcium-binding domain-containing protein [Thermomicrobiales bacterium]